MNLSKPSAGGFTLIELMITVSIVAILTAIAYPSYTEHVRKTRRAEAKSVLLDVSARLERFYADRNTYASATIESDPATDVLAKAATENGFYTISITAQDTIGYTIEAEPTGAQADDDCGTFSLDSTGAKTVAGGSLSADVCW